MWNEQFVDKHGKKKYRYYEKYKDPMTNKWRRVSVVLEKNNKTSQKEAQRLLDKKIDEKLIILKNEYSQEAKSLTLEHALDKWFEHFQLTSTSKFNTIRTYKIIINLIKTNINTSILVERITLPYIQNEFNNFNKMEISKNTLKHVLSTFKRTMKFISKQYGVHIDYLDDIEISKKNNTRIKEYLELDELSQIILYLKKISESTTSFNKKMKYRCGFCFIAIQALTGLRGGEVAALTLENISFDTMMIEVNGTIQWSYDENNNRGIKVAPKTSKSNRNVSFDSKTKNYLELRLTDLIEIKRSIINYVDRGFIFTTITGKPLHVLDINRLLKEACEACEINKHITTHSLRHTHISLLAQIGIPIKAIMDRVGHSDHKTTLEVYTHVTEKMEKDLINKLEELQI